MSIESAQANFERLKSNPYPGRGIVVGLNESGTKLVQVYWITGRSENSRNRVFGYKNGRLFTEPADSSKMKDPSLIIYNAMDERGHCYVVSNGDQTDTIIRGTYTGHKFYHALCAHQFEPDAPHYTPRIAAVSYTSGKPRMEMAILKKSPRSGGCERIFYCFDELEKGYGFCLTTYSGDGHPLPSFAGDPLLLPLVGDAEAIAETFWGALYEPNRIALAVKSIDVVSGKSSIIVRNRFVKV